jgi:hypothetical protein
VLAGRIDVSVRYKVVGWIDVWVKKKVLAGWTDVSVRKTVFAGRKDVSVR